MRFLKQAPNFVGIFTFPGSSFPDIVPSLIFQLQLVSISEWNFQTRDPPRSYFSCSFYRFKVPITKFLYFFIQIYTSRNDVSRTIFLIPTESDFLMIFLSLRNLPPFCSTIRISLLSVGLEQWGRFKNSYSSQAKWFGCIFLDRGKYTVENAWEMCCSMLQKVADPKKNISMHVLWWGMPDKEEKKKEVDQFRVKEEKDVGAGEDVLFQNTGTTIQMFKSGCEFSLLFSSLHIYNCWPYFWIYRHMFSLSFLYWFSRFGW